MKKKKFHSLQAEAQAYRELGLQVATGDEQPDFLVTTQDNNLILKFIFASKPPNYKGAIMQIPPARLYARNTVFTAFADFDFIDAQLLTKVFNIRFGLPEDGSFTPLKGVKNAYLFFSDEAASEETLDGFLADLFFNWRSDHPDLMRELLRFHLEYYNQSEISDDTCESHFNTIIEFLAEMDTQVDKETMLEYFKVIASILLTPFVWSKKGRKRKGSTESKKDIRQRILQNMVGLFAVHGFLFPSKKDICEYIYEFWPLNGSAKSFKGDFRDMGDAILTTKRKRPETEVEEEEEEEEPVQKVAKLVSPFQRCELVTDLFKCIPQHVREMVFKAYPKNLVLEQGRALLISRVNMPQKMFVEMLQMMYDATEGFDATKDYGDDFNKLIGMLTLSSSSKVIADDDDEEGEEIEVDPLQFMQHVLEYTQKVEAMKQKAMQTFEAASASNKRKLEQLNANIAQAEAQIQEWIVQKRKLETELKEFEQCISQM